MQIAPKLPVLVLCISLVLGLLPPSASATTEPIVVAGCPATKIDCPKPQKPKPTVPDRKKGIKGKKG
jgi:hypothetical protein